MLHGRGISIYNFAGITIGYWENGKFSTGYNIQIAFMGSFRVGEYYLKNGESWRRGTQYDPDGTESKYDEAL